eukprot:2524056-Rhodomonas_salina.1
MSNSRATRVKARRFFTHSNKWIHTHTAVKVVLKPGREHCNGWSKDCNKWSKGCNKWSNRGRLTVSTSRPHSRLL